MVRDGDADLLGMNEPAQFLLLRDRPVSVSGAVPPGGMPAGTAGGSLDITVELIRQMLRDGGGRRVKKQPFGIQAAVEIVCAGLLDIRTGRYGQHGRGNGMRQVLPDLPAFEAERRIAEKCACLCIVGKQLPDAAGAGQRRGFFDGFPDQSLRKIRAFGRQTGVAHHFAPVDLK